MGTKFLLPIAVLALLVSPALADFTRISDSVYSYVGETDASAGHSFAANAGIVIGDDGILVVDTLISAREAQRFLADIRKVTDKPIRFVVNTHTHLDHAFGNDVFARQGAIIVSHEADRALLEKVGAETLKHAGDYGLTPEDMAGTEIRLPQLTFSDRLTIDLGGISVEVLHGAASHTPGSLVVYLPDQKILFAGDILFTDFHPYLADGDLPGWGKTLDTLLAMDVERIIPGHGPLSTKADLKAMKDYLILFDTRARELTAISLDPEVVTAELTRLLPKRSLAEWMIGYNLKLRYLPGD